MALKVASTSVHWAHPSVPQSPSYTQALASMISSPSSKRRSFVAGDGALFCRYADKSVLFGPHQSPRIHRPRSCDGPTSRVLIIRRALSASLASFSDEEFSKQIQELALRFQLSDDDDDDDKEQTSTSEGHFMEPRRENCDKPVESVKPFDAAMEHPCFPVREEIIPANIERKANSVEIPFSLRMIKRKRQWKEGFVEAGESAYCSIKKAFSSMVFIIQELHSYSLQMREILFYEDLQGILARVQQEMNASFVWLFQQVFSHTPTLMVHVMILLANYSVHSMAGNLAIAATQQVQAHTEVVSVLEDQSSTQQKFDSSTTRTLNLSSLNGKMTSVGGNNGSGGTYKPVASNADGDGRFEESNFHRAVVPDGSSIEYSSIISGDELVSMQEEEVTLWNSFVEEASRNNEALDQETMQRFISPVDAQIETDDQAEYFKTELQYQAGLAMEPNNSLLLANYAQFLYLVAQDFNRAEEYFKKATALEPKDAEALSKYASFLWMVRNDLWAAEETYLEAISAEPGNSYYAANYAHFLWNTGGEDTCFPLSSPDSSTDL